MSLFEDPTYCWRETYFILFPLRRRPSAEAVEDALRALDSIEVMNIRRDDDGKFESATVYSPADYAAMDISFVGGEDVAEQAEELKRSIDPEGLGPEDQQKLSRLAEMDARMDIYHFERVEGGDSDDGCLDPTSLLVVMGVIVKLCHGVGVDPQSGSLV